MLKKNIFILLSVMLSSLLLGSSKNILNISTGREVFVDEKQNIYSHYGLYSIIKYSPKGKEVMRIGRKGEGPGDIKRIGWFAVNPLNKLLYVTEIRNGNRRVSMFSTDSGKYINNWKVDLNWNKWDGIPCIQFDYLGNVYIEVVRSIWRPYKSFSLGKLEKVVIKYSASGKKLKEFYRLKSDFMAEKRGKGQITIPYINYLYWKIDKDRFVIRENLKPFIYVFNLDGVLVKTLKLPFKKKLVTNEDLDNWEKGLKLYPNIKRGILEGWFDIKFWRKSLPFPKYKSICGGQLFFDSDGYLYSKKVSTGSNKKNIWAKIDINSEKIKLINFPKYRLKFIKNNYFFFKTVNKNDEEIIVKIKKELIKSKWGHNERSKARRVVYFKSILWAEGRQEKNPVGLDKLMEQYNDFEIK